MKTETMPASTEKAEIYSSPFCGFCYRAKALLESKQIQYTEYNVISNPEKRQEMMTRAQGRYTVPQIFFNGEHLGDCEELYRLESQGLLNAKLNIK